MFRFRACLLPLCVVFALGTLSAVAEDAPEAAPKEAKEAKPKPVRTAGTVASVDDASITVAPKAKKAKEGEEVAEPEPVTLQVDDKTKVRVDGKDATLADVKVGYAVTAAAREGEAAMKIDAWSPEGAAKRAEERKANAEKKAKDKEREGDGKADEAGM